MSASFTPQDVAPGTLTYDVVLEWARNRRVEAVEALVLGQVGAAGECRDTVCRAEIRLLEDLEKHLTGQEPVRLTYLANGGE